MKMTNRMKLMAEVQCWALWGMDNADNIDPSMLPISEELIIQLNEWSERFDAIYKLDDPNFHLNIGFPTIDAKNLFYDDGWLLLERLKLELPYIDFWYRDARHEGIMQEQLTP